jgi:hypothetical protein
MAEIMDSNVSFTLRASRGQIPGIALAQETRPSTA